MPCITQKKYFFVVLSFFTAHLSDSLITSKLHAKRPPFRGTKGSTVVGFFSSGKAKPIGFSSQFLGGLLSKLDEWTA